MSETEWDRIHADETSNATFIETDRLHRLREHVGELLRRTATRRDSSQSLDSSNRVAGRALFCVGDAGSGKTVTLRRAILSFSALRPVDEGEPRRPILSINAPDQPSLNAIYGRLLQCMDYPSMAARSTEVLRQRFLAQSERLGVVLIHIDDAANMTVGQDAFRARRSAQKIAACLRSLMEEEPPFSLIVSGLEPTLQLLEHDDALARRAQQVGLSRVRPQEHKVIAHALHLRAKDLGLVFSPDRDLIGRLVHAANQQFGLSFELAWHAIALAQAVGATELGACHFADAYFRRTSCHPGLNVFEAPDWERIDTTAIIPKLVDDPSVTLRRRR
ncbi:TniB family NTP-binding protein [Aureimonas sp. Leaf324]|uniref:TniB family NTP-binding protein n=1 Tax=Aureimonas sp. Leaf324 TaxID=1736336 RepID=UPI001FCE09C0|nr:TniB family NTP-binding protein [Aureimonas sp. Leaf324]